MIKSAQEQELLEMELGKPGNPQRVLIVSSHPLFGQGLRSLLHDRKEPEVVVVDIIGSVEEAKSLIEQVQLDLVIVDYDDERVNRDEFLAHFLESARKLRIVLLSLNEEGSHAIVYDRRTLLAAEIDDWLKEWNYSERPAAPLTGGEALQDENTPL
jgi:CheY-like chemotaxis protein